MDSVSTAVVLGVVAVLMLLGIGIVVNQLMRLRKFLKQAPPGEAPGEDGRETTEPPSEDSWCCGPLLTDSFG